MAEPIKKDDLYSLYNSGKEEGVVIDPIDEDEGLEDGTPDVELDELGNSIDNEDANEELTQDEIDRFMKLSDAKLKEIGIDDPKQWKSYQRLVSKKDKEWKAKEAEYLSKLQSNPTDEIASLKQEIAKIKNPVQQEKLEAPVPPKPPQMPADFSWGDVGENGTSSNAYMKAKNQFDLDVFTYQTKKDEYHEKITNGLQQTIQQEQATRAQQQQLEAIKADALSRFMKTGLNSAEAQDAWKEATENKDFYSPENVAFLYKKVKGIKPINGKSNKFDAHKNKRKFNPPPGLGGSGSGQAQPGEFSKTSDTSSMYKTVKT